MEYQVIPEIIYIKWPANDIFEISVLYIPIYETKMPTRKYM
jgi:hypothetical protein